MMNGNYPSKGIAGKPGPNILLSMMSVGFCILLGLAAVLGEEDSSNVEASTPSADVAASSPDDSEETQEPDTPPNAFEQFKLILDRNIFDPERRGPRERRRERRPEPPRESFFTLAGTMFYSGKQIAFFKSSNRSWSGAVRIGESIAGHRVTGIEFGKVTVDWEGEVIELSVGAARSKTGEDPWTTKASFTSSYRADTSGGESDASSDGDAADISALEGNDLLKQLMERRKKQLEQ